MQIPISAIMGGGFERLLRKSGSAINDADEWRRISLVALILDEAAASAVKWSFTRNEYAVIRREEGKEIKVLYCMTAPSKDIAFYMMCVDACDHFHYEGKVDHISALDPEYRTMNAPDLLRDVGDRAGWRMDRLWDCFVEFCDSGEIEPYAIVQATIDHYFFRDFQCQRCDDSDSD